MNSLTNISHDFFFKGQAEKKQTFLDQQEIGIPRLLISKYTKNPSETF